MNTTKNDLVKQDANARNVHSETRDKRTLYKTAKTTISCAAYRKGEIVGVTYSHQATNGTHWFLIGALGVPYPEHHLTDFVL